MPGTSLLSFVLIYKVSMKFKLLFQVLFKLLTETVQFPTDAGNLKQQRTICWSNSVGQAEYVEAD